MFTKNEKVFLLFLGKVPAYRGVDEDASECLKLLALVMLGSATERAFKHKSELVGLEPCLVYLVAYPLQVLRNLLRKLL